MADRNFIKRGLSFLNIKLSILGALGMGLIVFYVNVSHSHGWIPAGTAALKQFFYTLFVGGLLLKLLETFLNKLAYNIQGVILAILINSLITIILIYFVHSMKGTPEPFYSTIPTIILAPLGFTIVTIHKGYLKKESMDFRKASS